MRVVVVTPPQPVVDLAKAKQHLRVDHSDDDALITTYIAAATGHIDGPGGWLGRAIGRQTLEASFDTFDEVAACLPYPPVASIVSISYRDTANVAQPITAGGYDLIGNSLVPAWQQSWPSVATRSEAITVRYITGYEVVPDALVAAILLMTGDLYANRETVVTGTITAAVQMSTTVENLLSPFRVFA